MVAAACAQGGPFPVVLIDLDTTEVMMRGPDQVARYNDIFERLKVRAITGRALAALIEEIGPTLSDAGPSKP